MKYIKILFVSTCLMVLLAGCSEQHYSSVKTGKIKGSLIVEWITYDEFRYLPHPDKPLVFTRFNNESIQPDVMITDGGSIPRVFRFMKNYSPWGYGPAFIVHDWLFMMNHCKLPGHEKYTLEVSGQIMSEVIKTMMEDPKFGGKDSLALYSMHQAVTSDTAKKYFENGKCNREKAQRSFNRQSTSPPIARYEISFD